MTTRKHKGEQKREQLRQAAYRSFRDSGYHDTTVEVICQRANSSKGSFYWHYGSKQEIFIDILETWTRQIMDELYEQFEEAVQQDNYIEAITGSLAREIHRGRAQIPLWLEFTIQARHEPELRQALAKFYRRARVAIAEILRPLLENKVSEDELRGVAATIFGAYTGLLMQDLSDPERADAQEMAGNVMSVLGWWLRQLHFAKGDTLKHLRPMSTMAPTARLTPQPTSQDPPAPAHEPTLAHGARVTDEDLRDFLSSFLDAAEAVDTLRALVLAAAPGADERVIGGWKVVAYDHRGLFCYIKPQKRGGARIGFYRGAELRDPAGLLAGRGKHQRHADLPPGGPCPDRDALSDLVRTACALQDT